MNLTQILKDKEKYRHTHTQKQIIITLIKRKPSYQHTTHKKWMFSMFLAQNMRKFLIILIFRFWHLSFDGGKIKKFEFCNKKFIMASVIPQNFYSYLIKHYSFPHHIDINNPLSKKYSKFRIFKFSRHKIK